MLKRAFFTLYVVVVLVILLAGWGLDRLYQKEANSHSVSELERALILELARQVPAIPVAQQATFLQQKLQRLSLQGRVYRRDDLAESALAEELFAGEALLLTAEGGRQLYALLPDTDWVVRVFLPQPNDSRWYGIYLALFYLLLALVIFLWVWPLVRDLRSLEEQARAFGRAGATGRRMALGARSQVYQVSLEFNRMQSRIDELLASYKEMTYAVSHELRTPLARMKFALELAQASEDEEVVARQLASLRCDVNDMDSLINQLLGYAGFEAQTQQLVMHPEPATALVDLIQDLCARIGQSHPRLEFAVDNKLAATEVVCEWPLMERVLQNLLSNAARYADKKINVELYFSDAYYTVAVEDDGPGVAPEDRARVFATFTRLKQVPEKDTKGFGLGLAIVKRVMNWHGGEVVATDPQRLKGARFECRWPLSERQGGGRLSDP
ncbi:ATP-binding protein [Gilvimarinus sp. DA14]|uniref:ATP-binding protein n=1 Tax=Gilvimarinus sp. DA14 TaxID=2956798 RepID=UPI0020B8273A|nr:ATP-binding protein [Gilvimarinus sp. DA14]UTF60994.1 ATP-binding protein [Gilvimarinus sp. DA14]